MYMDPTSLQDEANRSEERPQIGLFRFWTDTKIDIDSAETVDVEYVEWTRIGDRYEPKTVEKIARLKGNPVRGRQAMPEWAVIEPHYDAWKMGKKRAEDGTAFSEWKGVDSRLVQTLEELKIYTIEAFVAVPSHQVGTIRHPHVSRWQDLAKAFLQDNASRAQLRTELAARDAELAEMKAQIAALQAPPDKSADTNRRKSTGQPKGAKEQ